MEVSALAMAKKITELAASDGITDITPLKLQKLLYFIEGGMLADNNITSFFPETPQAWKYGPVYVDIYEKFKDKQRGEPVVTQDFIDEDLNTSFDQDIEASIQKTWERYKDESANELVTQTHRTSPWIIAKNFGLGSRISKEDMREFFTAQAHEQTIT